MKVVKYSFCRVGQILPPGAIIVSVVCPVVCLLNKVYSPMGWTRPGIASDAVEV